MCETDRQTDSGCPVLPLLPHCVSLPPTPDLLNPNLKSAVICAMKISQQPLGLGTW